MMTAREQERLIETDDGVTLWTASQGAGPPMLLCHGGPGLWDQLEPLAEMVTDHVTAIRWDQRGAGRSARVGPYRLERFIADIEAIRSAYGFSRWIVGGHSWGATLALRYALAHPDRVDALVCLSGTDARWSSRNHERYRTNRLVRLGEHRERWEELRALEQRTPEEDEELTILTFSTDFATRADSIELAKKWNYDRFPINYECNSTLNAELATEDDDELLAACGRLDIPAVVIHGDCDPRPIDGPAELANALPRATLVPLSNVGHVPWAEHPHLLRSKLRTFVQDVVKESDRT